MSDSIRMGHQSPPALASELELRYLEAKPLYLCTPEDPATTESSEMGSHLILEHPLNNLWAPNQYLASINNNMPEGGYLRGWVKTSDHYRQKLNERYAFPLGNMIFVFKKLVGRACSRATLLSRYYFNPQKGRNWIMSDIEAYGRLYAAGFSLEKTTKSDGIVYFVVKKTAPPLISPRWCSSLILKLPRVGQGGKIITVYKLRTMYPYSQFLQEYVVNHNGLQEGGKIKNDPRVTPTGRFLRKYFIDELPNLINLLRGEIKLFGVRAISEQYLSLYPEDFQEYRQRFKPGLIPPEYVHLPQKFEEIIESERIYLQAFERRPFMTDLEYLFKAAFNIFFRGARSH